jgi:hypothetical protein
VVGCNRRVLRTLACRVRCVARRVDDTFTLLFYPCRVPCAGADRLTQREAELCSSARLLPTHYLSLKDVMMRDAQVHGHISRFDVSCCDGGAWWWRGGHVVLWQH